MFFRKDDKAEIAEKILSSSFGEITWDDEDRNM